MLLCVFLIRLCLNYQKFLHGDADSDKTRKNFHTFNTVNILINRKRVDKKKNTTLIISTLLLNFTNVLIR